MRRISPTWGLGLDAGLEGFGGVGVGSACEKGNDEEEGRDEG